MVKVSDALISSQKILKSSIPNYVFEAGLIAAHVLNTDTIGLNIRKNDEIDDNAFQKIISMSKIRTTGKPIAYITGHKEFMSLDFDVSEAVLIPRPETEELAELIINDCKDKKINILDLCTGSGAIMCSLMHYMPHATATGVDIQADAIEIARRNAKKLNLYKRASFIVADILSYYDYKEKFDIVVSNPPYIESDTIRTLDKSVTDFEPTIALDGGNDGLLFYKSISENAHKFLKKDGMLYFEIGYNQGEAVTALLDNKFKNIVLKKDLSGHDRIIKAQLA